MSMIHSSCSPVGRSASEMAGTANASTVLSMATSSTGSISTASASQRSRAEAGARSSVIVIPCGPSAYGQPR